MATFNEVVEQTEQEVQKIYDKKERQQVMIDIESLIDEMNGVGISGKSFQNYTSDELSRIGGKLAVLRSSLIHYKQECLRQHNIAEKYCIGKMSGARSQARSYLIDEATKKGEKAPTADDIKAEAERLMVRAYLIRDFHKNELEKVQGQWYGIPNILYSIEQRIKVLLGDKDTSKFYAGDMGVEIPNLEETADYSQAL